MSDKDTVEKIEPRQGDIRLVPEPGQAFVLQPFELDGAPVPRDVALARRRSRRAERRIERRPGVRVCADGDSWINILYPLSAPFGYDPTLFDILEDRLGHNNTENVAFPGDTFADMLHRKDYRALLTANTWDFFIFSGGGNDFLGSLGDIVMRRSDATGTNPKNYLKAKAVNTTFARLKKGYLEIARDVARRAPRVRMLVHTYDIPTPQPGGPYLGERLWGLGYNLVRDETLVKGILTLLVNRFHTTLMEVAASQPHVRVVDLRNKVKHWNDELHPKERSSRALADEFIGIIKDNSDV